MMTYLLITVFIIYLLKKTKLYLDSNVYKLFSTPVKDIDSLSNPNNKLFNI